MKSLKFVKLNLSETDILTRLEMKSVTGGYTCWCYNNDGEPNDPEGKEVSCDDTDNVVRCCGSDYDGMNCWS